MIEKAYAKINLGLNVIGKRKDGYHELDMVMVPVNIYDLVEVEMADETSFSCRYDVPWDETNIIYRTLDLLKKELGLNPKVRINITNNIPIQAGLGGSSSDAAAVLRCLNELLYLRLDKPSLAYLASRIGADVPFFVYQEPARVQGYGNIVNHVDLPDNYDAVLIKPDQGISTREAYGQLNLRTCDHPDMDMLMVALQKNENIRLGNSLEEPAFRLCPLIKDVKYECMALGYDKVLMSGSGSTVFVLVEKDRDSSELEKIMKKKFKFVERTEIITQQGIIGL